MKIYTAPRELVSCVSYDNFQYWKRVKAWLYVWERKYNKSAISVCFPHATALNIWLLSCLCVYYLHSHNIYVNIPIGFDWKLREKKISKPIKDLFVTWIIYATFSLLQRMIMLRERIFVPFSIPFHTQFQFFLLTIICYGWYWLVLINKILNEFMIVLWAFHLKMLLVC